MGKRYVLHVEFQTKDEDMRFRLMIYKGLLLLKHGLAVKQVVLYIGENSPKKPTIYQDEGMDFSFSIVIFHQIPHRQFLRSSNPEEVIFAILVTMKK